MPSWKSGSPSSSDAEASGDQQPFAAWPHMLLEIQTEASVGHVDSNDSYRVRHV